MGTKLAFFREVVNNVIDDRALNYGVSKAVDILTELKIEDEQLKQLLVKHFDLRYSEASKVLEQSKSYADT